jgi:hypothetical protein
VRKRARPVFGSFELKARKDRAGPNQRLPFCAQVTLIPRRVRKWQNHLAFTREEVLLIVASILRCPDYLEVYSRRGFLARIVFGRHRN